MVALLLQLLPVSSGIKMKRDMFKWLFFWAPEIFVTSWRKYNKKISCDLTQGKLAVS